MKLPDLQKLSDFDLNRHLASLLGWQEIEERSERVAVYSYYQYLIGKLISTKSTKHRIPNYVNNVSFMMTLVDREIEKHDGEFSRYYEYYLINIVLNRTIYKNGKYVQMPLDHLQISQATARQRAEAFILAKQQIENNS